MVLESFPLLVSHPIHEETDVNVDSQNRTDHFHDDAQCSHALQQPEQQAETSKKFDKEREQCNRDRHSRFNKVAYGARKTGSAEPAEHLLRSVGKENQPQDDAS